LFTRKIYQKKKNLLQKQYVLELRMQRAKRLLEEGTASVGEIAQGCGFASVPHFCRTFKSFTGESPTDYRHGHRRELL
jgi:AraC family transcriptional regulator of arabinose operon